MKSLLFLLSFVLLPAHAIEVGQTYRITSKKFPTKSLFVQDSKREAGTDIVLWTETDVPSQQWKVTSGGSNTTQALQNVYTGQYATPQSKSEGTKLTTNTTRSAGRLAIEAVDEAQGIYRISMSDKSLSLSAPASSRSKGAKVVCTWLRGIMHGLPGYREACYSSSSFILLLKSVGTSLEWFRLRLPMQGEQV